jgi:hypothetical protein
MISCLAAVGPFDPVGELEEAGLEIPGTNITSCMMGRIMSPNLSQI